MLGVGARSGVRRLAINYSIAMDLLNDCDFGIRSGLLSHLNKAQRLEIDFISTLHEKDSFNLAFNLGPQLNF